MTAPAPERSFDRAGWLQAAGLALVLGALSYVRHRHHWTGFDLAIFDQAAWQLSEGRAHISVVERHVLADHVSPVLYGFGLLYRIAATPAWFFAAQALAIGATIVPIRGVARHFEQPPVIGTFLVACSAPLLAAGMFDVHPSTLAVPFVAMALLAGVEDRPTAATLAAVAVVLCRADLALVLVGISVVSGRRARLGLLGVATVGLVASALVPSAFGDTNGWIPHFGHLGRSPVQAALHPWDVAGQLLSGKSLSTLLLWVAAAGVVVLWRPRWLLAIAIAGAPILLSRWEGTGLPWYHYGAPVAPLLMGGTLAGLATIAPRTDRWSVRAKAWWWLAPLLVVVVASPLSPLAPRVNRVWTTTASDEGRGVGAALAYVPDGVSVSADQRVLPHVSQRERAYLFPIPFARAADFFAEGSHPDLRRYAPGAVEIVVAPRGTTIEGYEVVREVEGLVVLRRTGSDGGDGDDGDD